MNLSDYSKGLMKMLDDSASKYLVIEPIKCVDIGVAA